MPSFVRKNAAAGLIALAALAAAAGPPQAVAGTGQTLAGRAVVIDGDTLEIGGRTIRLLHIDAPETGQPHGAVATGALAALTAGHRVVCRGARSDAYGRLLAECRAGQRDLGAALVRQGHAVVFRRYGDTHAALEAEARAARRGLWAAPAPVMPWAYRARRWEASAGSGPDPVSCPIKGNISRDGSRIYHLPWMRWYDRTRIDTGRGERWFCDEAEAQAAGWRRAPG